MVRKLSRNWPTFCRSLWVACLAVVTVTVCVGHPPIEDVTPPQLCIESSNPVVQWVASASFFAVGGAFPLSRKSLSLVLLSGALGGPFFQSRRVFPSSFPSRRLACQQPSYLTLLLFSCYELSPRIIPSAVIVLRIRCRRGMSAWRNPVMKPVLGFTRHRRACRDGKRRCMRVHAGLACGTLARQC
jgi:hypothetical protein